MLKPISIFISLMLDLRERAWISLEPAPTTLKHRLRASFASRTSLNESSPPKNEVSLEIKWQQLKLWNRFQSIFVEKHYSNRQIRDENHNFFVSRHDTNNQISRLKAWCVYFQDEKWFWTTEISAILDFSNLKDHNFSAQKWISHCNIVNFRI